MQSGRYKVVHTLKFFNEATRCTGNFQEGEVIYVSNIEKDRAEIESPQRGWVKTDDLILKVTALDVIKDKTISRKVKKKKMKVGKTNRNAKRRKLEKKLKKKCQPISKFYYKSSKTVDLFDGRGVKIGELFPNSIM